MGRVLLPALLATVLILVFGLYPYEFEARGGKPWLALAQINAWGLAVGVILFVPLGFSEARLAGAVLWRHWERDGWQGLEAAPGEAPDRAAVARRWANLVMVLVVLDAAMLGLIVETLQLWVPQRSSSIVDLLANTLGGTLGGIIAGVRAPVREPSDG